MKTLFTVHTSSKRLYSRHPTLDSLSASDVGEVLVAEQPADVKPQAFLLDLLQRAYNTGADVVVRLEDDVEVNRHLLHNIKTWRALSDPKFGVGFLSNADNYCPPTEVMPNGCYRSLRAEVSAALGQVFLRPTLQALLPALGAHPDHLAALEKGTVNFDHLVSRACFELGLHAYIHFPALVRETAFGRRHSAWGNTGPGRHPEQPDFAPNWKREALIPKVIQQIWIGDRRPPRELMASWADLNPAWEYKLWDNAAKWENQALIDAIPELHGKTDIMRYELLWREGGVYVDADSDCILPLEDFLLEPPAWASWENAAVRPGIVANGYLGARPHHPLFGALLDRCRAAASRQPVWKTIGSGLVSDEVRYHSDVHLWPSTMWCPRHFTDASDSVPAPIFAQQYWGSTLGYDTIAARRDQQTATHLALVEELDRIRKHRHPPESRGLPPYSTFQPGTCYAGV